MLSADENEKMEIYYSVRPGMMVQRERLHISTKFYSSF